MSDTFDIRTILIEDVTSEEAASDYAAAASESAQTASVKASEAGTQAAAATTARTGAETARGQAQTAAANAAQSETNAAGSASSASQSATTAAQSATTAGQQAQAASGSASTATTKATEAGQSAQAAAGSATTAATEAGKAGTSATQAATSASNAAGSASTASTAASTAATARDQAQGHASAASTSATNAAASATSAGQSATTATTRANEAATSAGTASTKASEAATSATNALGSQNAAATSATTAATARDQAKQTFAELLPSTFDQDGEYWTQALAGTPAVRMTSSLLNTTSFADVTGEGRVVVISSPFTTNTHITPKAYLKGQEGRRYRLTVRARHVGAFSGSSASAMSLQFRRVTASYEDGGSAAGNSAVFAAPDTWQTFTLEYTNPGTHPYLLPFAFVVGSTFGTTAGRQIQVQSVRCEDITSETLAANSASAAATSATNAAASATTAGQQATTATTRANEATTAAGTATTKASEAATSATNASGSATQAATSASTAATARDQAQGHASAASTSATNAAASATTAGTAATTATTRASEATTAAGTATTRATEAATSATNAKGSETAAATSATTAASVLTDTQKALNTAVTLINPAPIAANRAFGISSTGHPDSYTALFADSSYLTDPTFGPHISRPASGWTLLRPLAAQGPDSVFRVTARVRVSADMAMRFAVYWIGANGVSINSGSYANTAVAAADGIVTLTMVFGRQSGGLVTNAGGTLANWTDAIGIRFAVGPSPTVTGQTYDIFSLKVEDITAADQAARSATSASSSASAASTSASNASASATTAGQAASTASTHAGTAQTQAGIATTQAGNAATSATNAAGSASAAENYTRLASLALGGGMHKNPIFQSWNVANTQPLDFTTVVGNGTLAKVSGKYGNGVDINVTSAAGTGPYLQTASAQHTGPVNPSKLLVTVEIEPISGSFTGFGIQANWMVGTANNFALHAIGPKLSVGDGIQTYQCVIDRPAGASGTVTNLVVQLLSSHTASIGGHSLTRAICRATIHRFDIQEVRADSYIDQTLTTKATVDGMTLSTYLLRLKSGGATAALEMVAANNPQGPASQVRIAADDILLDGTVRAPQIAAGAITASKMAVGDFSNRVTDAEYNDLGGYWRLAPDMTFSIASNQGSTLYGQSRILTVRNMTSTTTAAWTRVVDSQDIPVTEGTEFYASLGLWANVSCRILARFGCFSQTGAYLGELSLLNGTFVAATRVLETSGTPIAGTRFVRAELYVDRSVSAPQLNVGRFLLREKDNGKLIVNGSITGDHIQANSIASKLATIDDAYIKEANITGTLSAAMLRAGTALTSSLTVDGTALSTTTSRANDPAARINAASTVIDPGKIRITGSTTLADWRKGGDETRIDGGQLSANTVRANALEIGSRNVTLTGVLFEPNRSTAANPATNNCYWSAGTVRWINDAGAAASTNISAGSVAWSSGVIYIFWAKGATTLSTTTSLDTAMGANNVVLATYEGGIKLDADYGRTIIDGSEIKTGTIRASQLIQTEALITKGAQIDDATITEAKITGTLSAGILRAGTALASTLTVDGTALSATTSRAADPAARVNAGSTIIDPGKIRISGSSTLSDWRGGADQTEINGGKIATDTITARSIQLIDSSTLVPDANFQDPASWRAHNGSTLSFSTDSNANVGTLGGRRIVATINPTHTTTSQYSGAESSPFAVQNNTDYAVRQMVWTSASVTIRVDVSWRNGSGTEVGVGQLALSTASGWREVSGTIRAPATAVSGIFRTLIRGDAATGTTVIMGRPHVNRQADTLLIADRAITGAKLIATENVITNVAQIGEATVDNAAIIELDAGKLRAGSTMTGTVLVDGRTIASLNGDYLFDDMSARNWNKIQGAGTVSFGASTWGGTTGNAHMVMNANGAQWMESPDNIPFDSKKLYRVTFSVRRVANTGDGLGSVYFGLAGVAGDKTTYVNSAGSNSSGSQHYFPAVAGVAQSTLSTNLVDYVCYYKGTSGTPGGAGTIASPRTLHTNVRFFRPLGIFNWQLASGGTQMVLNHVKVETVHEEVAELVNAGSVLIEPGSVQISGSTKLSNWIKGGDTTRIDGGQISANTIKANSLEIGSRNITLTGIMFEPNRSTSANPAANNAYWSAGAIRYIADNGSITSVSIAQGSVAWSSGIIYIYWVKGATSLSTTTSQATAFGADNVILATYEGGARLDNDYGRTVIDGSEIKTGTITATQLINTQALITHTAQITDGTITNAKISGSIQSDNFNATSGTGWRITKAGVANFHDLIVRGDLKANSVSDLQSQLVSAEGLTTSTTTIATITLGATDYSDNWFVHAHCQTRAVSGTVTVNSSGGSEIQNTSRNTRMWVHYRVMTGGVWQSWVQVFYRDDSSLSWSTHTFNESAMGDYDNVQYRVQIGLSAAMDTYTTTSNRRRIALVARKITR